MEKSFRQLIVWQKSIQLVKEIYRLTDFFPKHEIYGLSSQMRRAAVSIPSNIAEGYKRKHLGDYLRFLSISDASSAELETQLVIAQDLYKGHDYSNAESFLTEIQKMLYVLIRNLEEKKNLPPSGPNTL
jgi:four helix bundle protein